MECDALCGDCNSYKYDSLAINSHTVSETIQCDVPDFGLWQLGLLLSGNLVEYVIMQHREVKNAKQYKCLIE